MIGEIRKTRTPFYSDGKMLFKFRPALVIAQADAQDYIILPVSSVSKRKNLDPVYDVEIDPSIYPKLHLKNTSYVRTHKQTVIHLADFAGCISNMKSEYPDLYEDILKKREIFSNEVSKQARA